MGIELKSKSGVGFGSTLYDQSHRYMESGALDRIFFASHAVDGLQNVLNGSNKPDIGILNQTSQKLCAGITAGEYTRETVDHAIEQALPEEFLNRRTSAAATIRKYISSKLDGPVADSKSPIPLTQAMTELQRARCPMEMGIIHVPLNLRGGVLYDIERKISTQTKPTTLISCAMLSSSLARPTPCSRDVKNRGSVIVSGEYGVFLRRISLMYGSRIKRSAR